MEQSRGLDQICAKMLFFKKMTENISPRRDMQIPLQNYLKEIQY